MAYNSKTGRLTVRGKDIPTAKELGRTIVEGGKKFVKNVGVVGSTLADLAGESITYKPKGGALIPGFTGEPKSMRRGGTVKKTGYIKMHKGEKVIPAKKANKKEVSIAKKKGKKKKGGCK